MKQYKKWIIPAAAVMLIIIVLALKNYRRESGTEREWSLVYIPKTADGTNDFWTSLISGTRMAAQEYNASIEVMAPDREQDVERQNELLEQAIAMKPDALLMSPSSYTASNDLLREARDKGIPIVFIDSYTEENIQDLTVATDNLEVGRMLGEYVQGLLGEDSKIAIVSHMQGVSTAVEREQGFREGLGEKAKNIVDVVYCNSMFDLATSLTEELMEKYPDLEMIAGMNEYSSVGAARAVKAAGAQDRIKVVGVDSSQEAVQLMEQDIFKAFVVQKAFKMGYIGVRETIRLLQGESVEKNIDSGCELVTPENMYSSENEKLLFPFTTFREEKTGE